MGGFYRQKEDETRRLKRVDYFRQDDLSLGEDRGLITSLMLIKKFQTIGLSCHFWKRPKLKLVKY